MLSSGTRILTTHHVNSVSTDGEVDGRQREFVHRIHRSQVSELVSYTRFVSGVRRVRRPVSRKSDRLDNAACHCKFVDLHK